MKLEKRHKEEITDLVLDYLRENGIVLGRETNLQITIRPPVDIKECRQTDEFLDGNFFEFWDELKSELSHWDNGRAHTKFKNAARANNISTVRDLLSQDVFVFYKWRNCGRNTILRAEELLKSRGLYFGMLYSEK